jgi:hypothetical protein
MVKLLELDDCEQSEGVHALIRQEYPKLKYCPYCGKGLHNELDKIFANR